MYIRPLRTAISAVTAWPAAECCIELKSLPKQLGTLSTPPRATIRYARRFKPPSEGWDWAQPESQRAFLSWITKKNTIYSLDRLETFYSLTAEEITSRGGQALLKCYNDDVFKLLSTIFPNHPWLPWRFAGPKAMQLALANPSTRRACLEWLMRELRITSDESWKSSSWYYHLKRIAVQVSRKDVRAALKAEWPEKDWSRLLPPRTATITTADEIRFLLHPHSRSHPPGAANASQYRPIVERLASKYNLNSPQDWYRFVESKSEDLTESQAALTALGGSWALALPAVYPDKIWQEWNLSPVPPKFWHNRENRIRFFESIVPTASHTEALQKWYDFNRVEDFKRKYRGATAILSRFKGSLFLALRDAYPQHEWKAWKFDRAPHNFWNIRSNRRSFFDDFARSRSLLPTATVAGSEQAENTNERWYSETTLERIQQFGGGGMMRRYYSNSVYKALKDLYPEHEWLAWRFAAKAPVGSWWKDSTIVRAFLENHVAPRCGVSTMEDWYAVSHKQVRDLGGGRLLLPEALKLIYPDHLWNQNAFHRRKSQHRARTPPIPCAESYTYLEC